MTTRTHTVTARSAARIAGYGYVAIFLLAVFGNFFVLSSLVESGDAAVTAANVTESQGLFRGGLIAFTIVFGLDVVIAWALYVFFRGVNRDLSLLTAWFRLVYTVLLGVGLVFWFVVLRLTSDSATLDALGDGERYAQVMLYLDAFDYAWLIGLVCFGVHLILLGSLALRTTFIPKLIGALLMIAGAAYIFDTTAQALLANYEENESLFLAIVAVPSVIGEGAFMLWLLLRGAKNERFDRAPIEHRATESAVAP